MERSEKDPPRMSGRSSSIESGAEEIALVGTAKQESTSTVFRTTAIPSLPRNPSPTMSEFSDDLPSNVSMVSQLSQLPDECLSGDPDRPLRHVDETDEVYHYALHPMSYSVIYILLIELLERFSFYGLEYTQTSYLTGVYDENWNAGMDAVGASTYVSESVAVAYTMPFVGAYLGDALLGDYYSIIFGALVFYLPGLFLIASTTIPGFLGRVFNKTALSFGLLFLWPIGTGIVKSIVNVFGAKQFHPLLQSSQIEAYYVDFYMCINIGALVGGGKSLLQFV
jgi:proton-dependent oligopeptide transporter, POT family